MEKPTVTDPSLKNTRGATAKGTFRIFRSIAHWRGMPDGGETPCNREQRRHQQRLKRRQQTVKGSSNDANG
jgi:hypothetical protein